MIRTRYILGVLLLLALVGCANQMNYFEKEFKKIIELDKKYNTSFYTEALDVENRFSDHKIYDFDWNRTIISIGNIPLMVEELEKMREEYSKGEMTDDNKAIILFIEARVGMLESEKMYLIGSSFGSKGDSYDGFGCGERPYILNTSYHFNESVRIGQEASAIIDSILT